MAVLKSDQMTKADATPVEKIDPQAVGKVVRKYFSFTVPAGDASVNDTVELTTVPKGARLFGGYLAFEAMSSDSGTSQIQMGDGTTAAKYLGTTSVNAAGEEEFGHTVALEFGEKLSDEIKLTATVVGEAWEAGQELLGYVEYLL